MSHARSAPALHVLDLPSGPVLFDTNRVTTYRCSPLEADLVRAAEAGSDGEEVAAAGVAPDRLLEARKRLARLTRLSESLAGSSGLASRYSGRPNQLFLHVCNDCNLRCSYCYAGSCELGMGHLFMSEETARAAIDQLFAEASGDRPYVCTFAGGEPLLNWRVIAAAVRRARRRARERGVELQSRIFTNGTVMSEPIFELISANEIFLQITLDGPPESHDRLRPGKGGVGTSEKILETIRFLEDRKFERFTVRSNLCPGNSDPARIEEFFRRNGLEQFYLMPVMADKDSPYRLGEDDLHRIGAHYERLADRALEASSDGSQPDVPNELAPFVAKLALGVKTKRYCGAAREMLVVSPEGDLYPCPAMVGDAHFRIGSIAGGATTGTQGAFRNRPVDEKPVCSQCWARNLCGGGCALQAERVNGSEAGPDALECAVIQAKITAAVSLQRQQKGV